MTRSGDGAPWLLRSRATVEAKKIEPLVAGMDPLTPPLAHGGSTTGTRLRELSATLARAVDHPGGRDAKAFAKDPYREFFRDEKSRKKHRTVSFTFDPGGPSVGWSTRSGRVLALVPGRWTVEETMSDDWYLYFPKSSPQHRSFPHHYRAARWAYLTTSVVEIPARGRSVLLDCTVALTSFDAWRVDD